MSVSQTVAWVQNGDVGTGAACADKTQGRVPASAVLVPSPSLGYSPDLLSLGHPGWERVKKAMRVQQGLPRVEAQSQLGDKAARTPHEGEQGTDTTLLGPALLPAARPGGDSGL